MFWPSLAITLLFLVFGKPLLNLFGAGFAHGYPWMFVLAIGLMARASVGPVERLLNMVGEQKLCAAVYAGTFAINLALCFILIPRLARWGGRGDGDRDGDGIRASVCARAEAARAARFHLASRARARRAQYALGSGLGEHQRPIDLVFRVRNVSGADAYFGHCGDQHVLLCGGESRQPEKASASVW